MVSLKEYLQEKLPEYMIPAEVVFLVELPLISTGKIDRRALPDPPFSTPGSHKHLVAPTLIERNLARLWTEGLSVSEIGIHDSSFDLGGHSLAASLIPGPR